MNNAAITLAYFEDQPARVVFGPETPVNEQLDAAQDWAGKEIVPFPGTTHIEVWAPHGNAVRARFNFPAGATQVEGFEPTVNIDKGEQFAAEELAELEEKLKASLATIDSQKAEIANLDATMKVYIAEIATLTAAARESKPAEPTAEELPTVTVPPTGGPATPSGKSKGGK